MPVRFKKKLKFTSRIVYKPMKILIINVSLRPDSNVVFPPIGLGYIASAIHNAGYVFDLLDIVAMKC